MMAVGISVVTLVAGRSEHLANLLEGLRRCVPAPDELVIVDMGNTAMPDLNAAFPVRVKRLRAGRLPLAAARNAGAGAAAGAHLLFLDVDCIPRANFAGAMNAALAANDALICGEVRYLPNDAVTAGWTEAGLAAAAWPHPARRFPAAGLRAEDNAGLFWSLAFGIQRDRFVSLGGFDPIFEGYGAEDTDFGFRGRAAGVPLLFLGGTGAFHQHHGVFDPPLQHFGDIVANAKIFYARWGIWPMDDWLHKFASLGLVKFDGGMLEIIRPPSATEVNAAQRSDARF